MSITPGPWAVVENPIGWKHIIMSAPSQEPGIQLQVIAAFPLHNAMSVANASAVAALPDIVQAALAVIGYAKEIDHFDDENVYGELSAALKKGGLLDD